jgi:hypothetical protein
MNIALVPSKSSPQSPIAERILDTFPSGSYALSALLRLMDIVETTDVPTAAVECLIQPRLLVNPQFVAKHADTAEKLLVLVMHELHHVLLGHTTLFPRTTKVQNFVFDAVINGLVCRMFSGPEHTALFTDYYDHYSFPVCLLRPPPGWPNNPATAGGISALPEPQRRRAADVHAALYSSGGATYEEVFKLLPKIVDEKTIGGIPLLGGHQEENASASQLEHHAPILFDIVRGIVEQWPQPPDPIRGRSLADVLNQTNVHASRPTCNRSVLRRLISKVAGLGGAGVVNRRSIDQTPTMTPIPGLSRRSIVLRALGNEPLLHAGQTPWRRTVRAGQRVHIYLDVSGSMDAVKGALYGAALDCQEYLYPSVHLFSTKVADVTLPELRRGVCKSTGGTDIACVAAHIEANGVRRALIVTDGWVGTPRAHHHQTLSKTKLAVALLGSAINASDLTTVANFTEHLTTGA